MKVSEFCEHALKNYREWINTPWSAANPRPQSGPPNQWLWWIGSEIDRADREYGLDNLDPKAVSRYLDDFLSENGEDFADQFDWSTLSVHLGDAHAAGAGIMVERIPEGILNDFPSVGQVLIENRATGWAIGRIDGPLMAELRRWDALEGALRYRFLRADGGEVESLEQALNGEHLYCVDTVTNFVTVYKTGRTVDVRDCYSRLLKIRRALIEFGIPGEKIPPVLKRFEYSRKVVVHLACDDRGAVVVCYDYGDADISASFRTTW